MIQQATNLPSERFVDVYVCDDTCCQIFIVWIYISLLLWCLLLLVLLVQIQGVQVYMVDIYGSVSMLFAISHSNSNNDNNTNLKWSQCPMLMSDGDTHTLSLSIYYTIMYNPNLISRPSSPFAPWRWKKLLRNFFLSLSFITMGYVWTIVYSYLFVPRA